MTKSQAYIAFNLTAKVGPKTLEKLVADADGDIVEAWERYPNKVSRTSGEINWEAEIMTAERTGVRIVTPADEDYPEQLRAAHSYPLALYVKGSLALLSHPSIAIVGTRNFTEYGAKIAERLAEDLAAQGYSIVSGLATGIDASAHRGALAVKGLTAGIIGSGLDRFFPEENRVLARDMIKAGGAVVSQFPFGHPASQQTFPIRNQIVATLATAVVVVEAPYKSGALITAEIATDLGRTVMAVPGRIDSYTSQGCLSLIRDGATLIRNADDVLEALGKFSAIRSRAAENKSASIERPHYTTEEALIMTNVDDEGTLMDDLVHRTNLPVEKVNALTMALRLKGFVTFLPGNRIGPATRPV